MSAGHEQAGWSFFAAWVRGTFAGWLLGFVLVVLAAIGGDLIGVEEGDSQFMVGIAMGVGVGYAQGRVGRKWFGAASRWTWASTIGLGVPFVVWDLVSAIWSEYSFSLPLVVVICGFLVGFLQRPIIRFHSNRANWWVPASVGSWTLAAGTAAVSGAFPSGPSAGWFALLSVGMILLGGLVLGIVTGGALVWILRH